MGAGVSMGHRTEMQFIEIKSTLGEGHDGIKPRDGRYTNKS